MVILGMLRIFAAVVAVASPSPTPSTAPEIAHVVTSDRSEQTLRNTTRTTYVVSAETIAKHGYRTVSDALADVPGVEINRYGPIGSNANVGIRGSSSAQVLFLIDGLPASGGFANSVTVGTISTVGVRRIEVVEGGGSTLYGTGSIGGIINVITDGQSKNARASATFGSFGDRELRLSADGFSLERIVATNGYDVPGGSLANSDYAATTARFGLDRTFGTLTASLRTSLESDHIGAPGPFAFASTTSREDDVNADASLALTWRHPQAASTIQIGGSRQQIAFGCDAVNDPNCFFLTQTLSTESRTMFDFRNVVTGASERLIYGFDLSRGIARADDGGLPKNIAVDALAQSAAYVQQNWQLPNGELYAGLRAERDGSLGGDFSPALGWRTSIGHDIDLKANISSAFRAPNASELYFPGYGNSALHPERAQVGDLSISDRALLGGVTLGWFTNRTNQLIVATDLGGGVFAPENVAHAFMQGFTFDAQTRPLHGVTAALRITDLYRATNLDGDTRLPNDPVVTADYGLTFTGNRNAGIFDEAGISAHNVGARGFVDQTQAPFDQPVAYTAIDAYTRFRVTTHLTLSLRGFNLGNERCAEVSGYPMAPRSFAVEISTK